MLINRVIWRNQLLWNRFRITYGEYLFFIRFNVVVETKRLGIKNLSPYRLYRLELMDQLRSKGMSTKQISDFMNYNGIKTPKGLEYYPKLVWMSLKKYDRRIERYNSPNQIISIEEDLRVQPIQKKLLWRVFL